MTPATLKARAEAIGFTQRDLAVAAGMDETSVYRIFAGLTDPRLSSLTKLARAITDREAALRVHLSLALPDASPETNQASDTPPGRSSDRSRVLDRPGANSISNSG